MTPYEPKEVIARLRSQRPLLILIALIPILVAAAMILSGQFDLWYMVALIALTVAAASTMRMIWQISHYKTFEATQEYRVLKIALISATVCAVGGFILHYLG